jgi:hypothetical protein
VLLEIHRLDGRLAVFQVFRGCHDIANAAADTSSDHAGVLQLAEAVRLTWRVVRLRSATPSFDSNTDNRRLN